jgi:hypothetical protein
MREIVLDRAVARSPSPRWMTTVVVLMVLLGFGGDRDALVLDERTTTPVPAAARKPVE